MLRARPVGRGSVLTHHHARLSLDVAPPCWQEQTSGMPRVTVRRVDFGYFVRPADETGTGGTRVVPCLGYLVEHPHGLLLTDTGMGTDAEFDSLCHPRRRPVAAALSDLGVRVEDVGIVVNCHLHFDHCGGNPEFPGSVIIVQRVELEAARTIPDYTLPELIEAPGLRYEVIDGEAEVLPDIVVAPTPGHTAGHQSLIVRGEDGTVVVAGQSHDTTSDYAADALAWRTRRELHQGSLPTPPGWTDRLQGWDPRRVVFAHDHSVWEP
jgi:N-acyl homoserine lactone hydrolase